jgi:hypothetical protein
MPRQHGSAHGQKPLPHVSSLKDESAPRTVNAARI